MTTEEKTGKEKPKEKEKPEKPEKPEGIELKEVAKQAGLEPREARAILRKLNIRGEEQRRARWVFPPAAISGIVAKIKASKAEKEKAKAEKATSEE